MDLKTFVTFEADFADDGVFDTNGEIVRPGGFGIAVFLSTSLRDHNLNSGEPVQHSFYGWCFEVETKHGTIWFLLQFPGPWLLLSESRFRVWRKFSKAGREEHMKVLSILDQILTEDNRFKNVRWLTKREYESD